jgi:hypothetical protein
MQSWKKEVEELREYKRMNQSIIICGPNEFMAWSEKK